MAQTCESLWEKAYEKLRQKDKDTIPPDFTCKPEKLAEEVENHIRQERGRPIRLPGGENLFVQDVLQNVFRWVKKFVEVGDVAVSFDPGHAALPWAMLRFVLQAAINNLEKHAAVLEGVERISYYLVWTKIEERHLAISFEAQDQLQADFVKLYKVMLEFMARSIRFLRDKQRVARSIFSSESKFRDDIDQMGCIKQDIESHIRQIFNQIDLEQHNELRKARDQLDELQKPVLRVEASIQSASSILNRTERESILDWASKIPFQKHFSSVEGKALPGTGQWLFQDTDFMAWHNCSYSQMLWLHGISGSGKSTLISLIIRSLVNRHKRHQAPYPIYFFCLRDTAEPERADPEQILRSLVRQASDLPGDPPLHPTLRERYHERRKKGDISAEEATSIIIKTIERRPVTYILIDALDECDLQRRDLLVDCLKTILSDSSSLVKIFVSSRDSQQDIAWSMRGHPALCIDASRNGADIDRYVHDSVVKAIQKKKLLPTECVDTELQNKIEDRLRKGAAGMFRWVALQLEYLYTLRKRSVLINRLDKLPPGLHKIYEELYEYKLKELGKEQAEVVRKILSWLLVAMRPLSTKELCQLVCAPEEPDMTKETVIDMCFDLVSLDGIQDQFRFSHLSVREFLESRPEEYRLSLINVTASYACLDLLNERRLVHFQDYASVYWASHSEIAIRDRENKTIEQVEIRINEFLSPQNTSFRMWNGHLLQYIKGKSPFQLSLVEERLKEVLMDDEDTIFIAASFGFFYHLQQSLFNNARAEKRHPERLNALYLASKYGHLPNVKILLEAGVDVNAQRRKLGTALYAASSNGHKEIVQLLLAKDANVNADGGFYGTALQAASSKGHKEIVQLLLAKDANVNAEGGRYGTALYAASL